MNMSDFKIHSAQFNHIAVGVAQEKLSRAPAPAASGKGNPKLCELRGGLFHIGNRERDMPVKLRIVGRVRGQVFRTHQMKLESVAQIVPASRKAKIRAFERGEAEDRFVKRCRALDVRDENARVMKA